VNFRPREGAGEVQLSEAKLAVGSVGSGVDRGGRLGGDGTSRRGLVAAAVRRRRRGAQGQVAWLGVQGTHAEREVAVGTSRSCHGLWRGEEPGPDGLGGPWSGSAVGSVGRLVGLGGLQPAEQLRMAKELREHHKTSTDEPSWAGVRLREES
jgi:hypothetical protein